MKNRILWLTLAAGCLLLSGASSGTAAPADTSLPHIEAPNGLRIPAAVRLLKPTPFYDTADLASKPLGSLSAQEVEVIGAEASWSSGRSWYKIRTWLGDKWMSPEPWTVEVKPPKTILLTGDTPLYGQPKLSAVSSASISAQEVEVVGAERQWHYMDAHRYEDTWLQIRTSWLGDQWIRVPLAEIGTFRPVDRKWYYTGVQAFQNPKGQRFPDVIENRTLHITGEFTTVFDIFYRVDNGKNPVGWVGQMGYAVQEISEPLTLPRSVLLFAAVGAESGTRLEPQTVQAFEKIDTGPAEARPDYADDTGVWYHVRTNQGEGWINRAYGEPEVIRPASGKLRIGEGGTELYRYPHPGLRLKVDRLGSQTLAPTGYWEDPSGQRWYQADTYAGKVWLLFREGTDTILTK
ncbi:MULTISPECIES: hypothetical protein [Paenibacillus]|uniref:hypothetical protein n=1 Tax=Paenibacillus TaxID=44249 RepID=UPI0022B89551|nr:hypothetical protein [Paenibacillus caseinilyticus]MCZ8522904.1 hypothetical protein [Paenibacillus caseinilyticus]